MLAWTARRGLTAVGCPRRAHIDSTAAGKYLPCLGIDHLTQLLKHFQFFSLEAPMAIHIDYRCKKDEVLSTI